MTRAGPSTSTSGSLRIVKGESDSDSTVPGIGGGWHPDQGTSDHSGHTATRDKQNRHRRNRRQGRRDRADGGGRGNRPDGMMSVHIARAGGSESASHSGHPDGNTTDREYRERHEGDSHSDGRASVQRASPGHAASLFLSRPMQRNARAIPTALETIHDSSSHVSEAVLPAAEFHH